MNEKGLAVLEQYDLDIRNARRGRDSFLIDTDKGWKILTEFSGTEARLQFQSRVMEHLKRQGMDRLDFPIADKEGNFLVKDKDEITYVLREWHEGRECDARNLADVQEAMRSLAFLHRCFVFPDVESEKYAGEISLKEEFSRKNTELRKIRKFIRSRKQKNPFEQEFLKRFEEFYEEAKSAEEAASSKGEGTLYAESLQKGCLCHGDFNHHHVLLSDEGTALIEFRHCHYGIQVGDFYQFFRKILEKTSWDFTYGTAMLREYNRVRPLSESERNHLKMRLLYPEKFWKLANHYYGSNKAWLPVKNIEKLEMLTAQRKQKKAFLEKL